MIGFQGQVVQCRILEQQMAARGFLFDAARRLRAHSRDGLVSWGWEHGQDLSVGYRPADCCGDGISSHDRLDDYKHGARSLSPRESARCTPQCASNVSMALGDAVCETTVALDRRRADDLVEARRGGVFDRVHYAFLFRLRRAKAISGG